MTQIPLPVFAYGFVGVIFGLPFLYFAWRAGQCWRRGENLLMGRIYPLCLAYSALFGFRAISTGRWAVAAVALVLLVGSSWMYLVERNDSRA